MSMNPQDDRNLKPGTRLGPYEVTELIGTGSMDAVYRARDHGSSSLRFAYEVRVPTGEPLVLPSKRAISEESECPVECIAAR
jgi:hypothetical protein